MRLGGVYDLALEGIEALEQAAERAGSWLEPRVRLGVTGLSGAGKTVFITALAASLMRPGRLVGFAPDREGGTRLLSAVPAAQPDADVPRFPLEANIAALTGTPRRWPASTTSVSEISLALRYRDTGFLASWGQAPTLHLDIVDYPGEWILDLALLETDYDAWAAGALAAAETPPRRAHAEGWRRALAAADPAAEHSEPAAAALAAAWAEHLRAAKAAGIAALTPGRFLLMPESLVGAPAVTFAPLPPAEGAGRESLRAEMARRFEAYKRTVVVPFFRKHFEKIDRQAVLIDPLGALAQGPRAFAELMASLDATLAAFRHGRSSALGRLLGARRIDRLLVAASKADHLHHTEHPRFEALVQRMLRDATARAAGEGTELRGMAIAAVRATIEGERRERGQATPVVRGRLAEGGAVEEFDPVGLPADLDPLFAAAADPAAGAALWAGLAVDQPPLEPPAWGPGEDRGPPHIRLDRALDFLIGDKMR